MATFALVHGSGDGGWAWHLVQQALRERGHDAVAPDLPTDREDATWEDCAEAIVRAVGSGRDVVLVGHSSGGFVLPLAAERVAPVLQVFVAAMVPEPGETPADWFENVGWSAAVEEAAGRDDGLTGSPDPMVAFYHDVPVDLATQAMARERPTSERLGSTPSPPAARPTGEVRYLVTSHDRFIPPEVQRRVAAERLGLVAPDEIASGHCVNLSRPDDVAGYLVRLAEETSPPATPRSTGPSQTRLARSSRTRRSISSRISRTASGPWPEGSGSAQSS
ncbi:alpha/beta hydrolase [Nocardioides pantholopis]|uniref:alpha/beta hydrolase n=1 Tax=Nocardioides pantholopis TaxID=2483798 RepID=UPI000F07F31F|nr:alpha/beta hydrolase [Nocardioides pantholopis]